MNYNDPKLIAKAKRDAERVEAERKIVVQSILKVPQGREWFYNFLSECGVFRTPFTPGDPHATAFNCGQQNVGLRLIATLVAASPGDYLLMLKEQEESNARSSDAAASTDPRPEFDPTWGGPESELD